MRDTTKIYPGKVMHIGDALTFDPNILLTLLKSLIYTYVISTHNVMSLLCTGL